MPLAPSSDIYVLNRTSNPIATIRPSSNMAGDVLYTGHISIKGEASLTFADMDELVESWLEFKKRFFE